MSARYALTRANRSATPARDSGGTAAPVESDLDDELWSDLDGIPGPAGLQLEEPSRLPPEQLVGQGP